MKKELLLEDTDCALCGESMPKGSEVNYVDGELFCDECLEERL